MLSWIALLEYLEVTTSVRYHLDESASRMVVLLVLLQVSCKLVDLLSEHGDLHLLGARVFCVDLVPLDDCLLFLR